MKNTWYSASDRSDARRIWNVREFNINFRNRENYKKAVRVLMNSETLRLVKNGRYLSGPEYGYVSFVRRSA